MSKKERRDVIEDYWRHQTTHELDLYDKGDHLEVCSCSGAVAAWWFGTLRAAYPQDVCGGSGDVVRMNPAQGVTLELSRKDGALRIRGKRHVEWFRDNFAKLLETGSTEYSTTAEMKKVIDSYLSLDDGHQAACLLYSLPTHGGIKHSPTYVYRLWRGLLDEWIASNGTVYVVCPLMDARRLADIILLLVKHRLSMSRVVLLTLAQCDDGQSASSVLASAKKMLQQMRGPNGRRLVADRRLTMAEEHIELRKVKDGLYSKFIACCLPSGMGELMLTSASYHRTHFEADISDTVTFFRVRADELAQSYLAPLGLTRPFSTLSTASGHSPGHTCPGPAALDESSMHDVGDLDLNGHRHSYLQQDSNFHQHMHA